MVKLLNAYKANPTVKNAARVATYLYGHPMCVCMLLPDESELLDVAKAHAARGEG